MADSPTPDPKVTQPEPSSPVPKSANTTSPVIEVPEPATPVTSEPQPEAQTISSTQVEKPLEPVEAPPEVENPVPEVEVEAPKTSPPPSQPEVKVEPVVTPPPISKPAPEVRVEEREVIKEVKVVDEKKVTQLAQEKYQSQLVKNQKLGNEKRKVNREQNLNQIVSFAQAEKIVTNQQIRDLLHVSQSTATNYLTTLVNRGILRMDRKAKATTYSY